MKLIALIIAGAGAAMCAAAFVLLTEEMATPERKAAVEDLVANPDVLGLDDETADALKGAVMVTETLTGGIFYGAPVDLAAVLPSAPEGWLARDYAPRDGTAITGEAVKDDLYGVSAVQELLRGLEKTSQSKLDVARTYQSGERMIVIRLFGKLDTFRHLETWSGEAVDEILALRVTDPEAPVLAWIDGLALRPAGGILVTRGRLTGFRRLMLDTGHAIRADILTNASDADLAAVLADMDASALQEVLPRPTEGYVRGAGLAFVEDGPLADTPPMPPARKLAEEARHLEYLDQTERALLREIASGDLATREEVERSVHWSEDAADPLRRIVNLLP